MTTAKRLMTAEELFKLPDDGRRYELLDGVLVEMAPTNRFHGRTENRLGYVLTKHAEEGAGGEV